MHTSRPKPSENATRQLMALLIAGLALGGPLVGMMLVSLGGHSYMHLLPEYAPLQLSLAILSVGGTAVGLAYCPPFFLAPSAATSYPTSGPISQRAADWLGPPLWDWDWDVSLALAFSRCCYSARRIGGQFTSVWSTPRVHFYLRPLPC